MDELFEGEIKVKQSGKETKTKHLQKVFSSWGFDPSKKPRYKVTMIKETEASE